MVECAAGGVHLDRILEFQRELFRVRAVRDTEHDILQHANGGNDEGALGGLGQKKRGGEEICGCVDKITQELKNNTTHRGFYSPPLSIRNFVVGVGWVCI